MQPEKEDNSKPLDSAIGDDHAPTTTSRTSTNEGDVSSGLSTRFEAMEPPHHATTSRVAVDRLFSKDCVDSATGDDPTSTSNTTFDPSSENSTRFEAIEPPHPASTLLDGTVDTLVAKGCVATEEDKGKLPQGRRKISHTSPSTIKDTNSPSDTLDEEAEPKPHKHIVSTSSSPFSEDDDPSSTSAPGAFPVPGVGETDEDVSPPQLQQQRHPHEVMENGERVVLQAHLVKEAELVVAVLQEEDDDDNQSSEEDLELALAKDDESSIQTHGSSFARRLIGAILCLLLIAAAIVFFIVRSRQDGKDDELDWKPLGQTLRGDDVLDGFGHKCVLSANGKVLAVGAPLGEQGYVKVYRMVEPDDGGTVQWEQMGSTLYGPNASAIGDLTGVGLDLTSDGLLLAVGTPRELGRNEPGIGSVRVYAFNGTDWEQNGQVLVGDAPRDDFGTTVSFASGVGTMLAVSSVNNDENGPNSGKVQIFQTSTDSWKPAGAPTLGDNSSIGGTYGMFGLGVSMSADGFRYVASARRHSEYNASLNGYVEVYNSDGRTQWNRLGQRIVGAELDELGVAVSMSSDGNTFAVSAGQTTGEVNRPGYVQVYELRDNSKWTQLGSTLVGDSGLDVFGASIKLSADGRTLAVGAVYGDVPGRADAGYVRVYQYDGTDWKQSGSTLVGEAGSAFGSCVSFSADASILAAGSFLNSEEGVHGVGSVNVFSLGA